MAEYCAQLQLETGTLERNKAKSRWSAFLKSYLVFGIKMAQVNYAGAEQDGFGPPTAPRSKLPMWSRAAEIYYYYFTIKIFVSGLLQYNYELANEEFIVAMNSSSSSGSSELWLAQEEKESQLARAIELVEMIGYPYYEVGPIMYIVAILFAHAGFHFFLEIRIYNYLRGPIKVGVARLFLNPKRERELMVKNELELLIDNIVQSADNCLDEYKDNIARSQRKKHLVASNQQVNVISHILQEHFRELKLLQAKNVEILRAMVARGELDPLNRRPEWTRLLARIYCTLVLTFTAGGCLLTIFFFIWVPCSSSLYGIKLHYNQRGILFGLETIVFYALYNQWVAFSVVLISMNTLDQIVFAMELKRMVVNLAVDIAARDQQVAARPTSGGSHVHMANRRLMCVLIQYRLFKQQLFGMQPVLGVISFNIISATLLGPALGRIYAAHLSAKLRQIFIVYCLFIVVAADILIMPACYLHARCLELYRALSHLLARLDQAIDHQECNRTSETSRGPRDTSLDRHTLSLLRRELQMAEFTTQQFATNAHFMRLTFSNLIAVNFYSGLWLVPMFMRSTSGLNSGTSALLDILT